MEIRTVEENGVRFIEGVAGEAWLREPRDASLVIEACFSAATRSALLYGTNLTPGFFDVSSRDAAELLQKLRSYRVRLAVVREQGAVAPSSRFHELLEAERRDGHFNVFEGRQPAVSWLTATRARMEPAGHD